MAAPRLGRAQRASLGPEDEKFALGDLVSDVADDQLDRLAHEIGHNLTGASLRSYREVARAWPQDKRVAASWTAHRTLMNHPDRFDIIQPKMTLRQAQKATGKNPADTEHPSRWGLDRLVPFIITQLLDTAISKAVREELDTRKGARAARTAVKMVDEERSAEYREALRELREARDAKSPERAIYEIIFKLRDYREYVRAIGKASDDEMSFVSDDRRPDIAAELRDLAFAVIDVLGHSGLKDEHLSAEAIEAIKDRISTMQDAAHKGVVIPGEIHEPPIELTRPTIIGGTLA
jgi:hypothetical protein